MPRSIKGMSDSTIQQLFVNLERTIHDRLNVIQEVMQNTRSAQPAPVAQYAAPYSGNVNYAPCQDTSMLLQKIYTLEATVKQMNTEMGSLREKIEKHDILPLRPIDGIEVVPKREVVLEETPLSFADRLLLNKKALKALEAEEMGEVYKEDNEHDQPMDIVEDDEEDQHAEADAAEDEHVEEEEAEEEPEEETEEAEEEPEEEAEEAEEEAEEAEEEAEAEELEEFEYKGSTYYRDSENNVFMTDEEGELVDQPIGTWNAARQRIVMTRA